MKKDKPEWDFKDDTLLIVTWGDAYSNMSYYDKEDTDASPMIIRDVGWQCEHNDEVLVLCCSLSETGRQRNLSVIPNVNIISIEQVIWQ